MNVFPSLRLTSVRLVALVTTLFLTVPFGTGPARAQDSPSDPKLLARAKVSREEAQKIVLARVPNGRVQSAELEVEDGVLRWSFDLKTPGSRRITEVGVDARTGKVIEKRVESARDEAREKQEERREARQGRAKE